MTGMADVPDAVERIADVLAKQNIRHAFGGAIAQNFWGIVRATQDVDVLALIPSLQLPAVVERLEKLYQAEAKTWPAPPSWRRDRWAELLPSRTADPN